MCCRRGFVPPFCLTRAPPRWRVRQEPAAGVRAGARARLYPGADFRASCRPPQSGVSMHTAPLVALFVGDLVVGEILLACSPAAMGPVTVFVDPGKYQYYNCEQLAGQRTYWTNRELELKLLMDKAEQGTGGTVVNVIAYRTA